MAQTLFNLGSIYQAQERWTDAESALAQGLAISRAIGDRRREANALGDLSVVDAAPGQSENAIRHLQEAGAIANAIADEGVSANTSRTVLCQYIPNRRGLQCA